MRVLFFGDMASTGFGSVTTDLGRQMLDQGADVRFVSQNDTGDDLPEPFRSRTVDLVAEAHAVAGEGRHQADAVRRLRGRRSVQVAST